MVIVIFNMTFVASADVAYHYDNYRSNIKMSGVVSPEYIDTLVSVLITDVDGSNITADNIVNLYQAVPDASGKWTVSFSVYSLLLLLMLTPVNRL